MTAQNSEKLDLSGVERILFGTCAPLQYIGVPLTKLAFMKDTDGLNDAQIDRIKYKNIAELLEVCA